MYSGRLGRSRMAGAGAVLFLAGACGPQAGAIWYHFFNPSIPVDAAPTVPTVDAGVTKAPAPRGDKKAAAAARKVNRAKAKVLYKQGMKQYASGNRSAARASFAGALKLRPGYSSAYRGLALVHQRLGSNAKAVRYFKKYLRASPRAKDADKIRQRIKKLGG